MKVDLPTKGIIHWLVNIDKIFLGFYVIENNYLIIGGPTGTHMSGHSDRAQNKWEQILSQGYISLEEAKIQNIIQSDFIPPKLSKKDRFLVYMIERNKGFNIYRHFKPWWRFWE